jgi:hypothetical protein
MLSAGLMVSLLLAVHGDEDAREEKFRGALLAQNASTVTDPAEIRREIEVLTFGRPSFPPGISGESSRFAAARALLTSAARCT